MQRHNEQNQVKALDENINDERTKDNIFLTEKDGLTFNSERIDKIIDENYTGAQAVPERRIKMYWSLT